MATTNFFYGLARGQSEQMVGDLVVVGTATNGTSSDFEFRVQTVNGTTNTGATVMEAVEALEMFKRYLLNNGIESQDGVDIPNKTLADHL